MDAEEIELINFNSAPKLQVSSRRVGISAPRLQHSAESQEISTSELQNYDCKGVSQIKNSQFNFTKSHDNTDCYSKSSYPLYKCGFLATSAVSVTGKVKKETNSLKHETIIDLASLNESDPNCTPYEAEQCNVRKHFNMFKLFSRNKVIYDRSKEMVVNPRKVRMEHQHSHVLDISAGYKDNITGSFSSVYREKENEDEDTYDMKKLRQGNSGRLLRQTMRHGGKSNVFVDRMVVDDGCDVGSETIRRQDKYDVVTEQIGRNDNCDVPREVMRMNDKYDVVAETIRMSDKYDVAAETIRRNYNYDVAAETLRTNYKYDVAKETLRRNYNYDVAAETLRTNDNYDVAVETLRTNDKYDVAVETLRPNDKYDIATKTMRMNDKLNVLLEQKIRHNKCNAPTNRKHKYRKHDLTTVTNNKEKNINYSNYRKGVRDAGSESKVDPVQVPNSIANINKRTILLNTSDSNQTAAVTSSNINSSSSKYENEETTNSRSTTDRKSGKKKQDSDESSESTENSETSSSLDSTDTSGMETTDSSGSAQSRGSSAENDTNESAGNVKKKDTSSSSSSSSGEKRNKKRKKRKGFFEKLMKSSPHELIFVKMALWFPVGIGISVVLYFMIIQKMDLKEKHKALIGTAVGLLLSLTFSFSVQMRCVMTLVIPSFVGKAGRSYFAAFAIVYLINGPITNIMDNCKEIVRTMTCNAALTANHSKTKWALRLHPVENALGDLMKDNFLITKSSRAVKKSFTPLRKEVETNMKEIKVMEASIKKVEKDAGAKSSVVDKIEMKYKTKEQEKEAGKQVEKEWEKKLDLRCQSTYSNGVQRCKDKMGKLWDKCLDKLWVLGYLLCWPLKITVFCEIIKMIPSAIGMECNSVTHVSPGFGETYLSAKGVMDNMESGSQVNMQYKIVGSADADYMPVEEMRQTTIREVNDKIDTINISLSLITHLLTFTFLIIFYGAYKYNSKYLTEFGWDNKYITPYFRHIDARRKAQQKKTLLPLKKAEKKEFFDPTTLKMGVAEKKVIIKGTIKLILRVLVSAIICYMDNMFYKISLQETVKLSIIRLENILWTSRFTVKGFMSALVRSFLEKFNSKHNLDSITTNYECLPKPSKTDVVIISFIFGTYLLVWVFMFFESFGLRMRRVIASFYYRKREKKRILFLYNEMYRKRIGFLGHMRKKVRKELREREFKKKIGLLLALKRRFPFLTKCLNVFKSAKDTCIICGELETRDFFHCPTEGCGVGYCRECWIDIKKKCYACGQFSETEDDTTDSETANDGDSSVEETE